MSTWQSNALLSCMYACTYTLAYVHTLPCMLQAFCLCMLACISCLWSWIGLADHLLSVCNQYTAILCLRPSWKAIYELSFTWQECLNHQYFKVTFSQQRDICSHRQRTFGVCGGGRSSLPLSTQLSVSSLSVCPVFVSMLFSLLLLERFFLHLPSNSVFHSVFCHCLSAPTHSQHSSLSPFFCLSWLEPVSNSNPATHLLVFSFDLYTHPFSLCHVFLILSLTFPSPFLLIFLLYLTIFSSLIF